MQRSFDQRFTWDTKAGCRARVQRLHHPGRDRCIIAAGGRVPPIIPAAERLLAGDNAGDGALQRLAHTLLLR